MSNVNFDKESHILLICNMYSCSHQIYTVIMFFTCCSPVLPVLPVFLVSPSNKIRRILSLAEELETIPPHSKGRLTVEYYHQIKTYLHKVSQTVIPSLNRLLVLPPYNYILTQCQTVISSQNRPLVLHVAS